MTRSYWLFGNRFTVHANHKDTAGRYDLIEGNPASGYQTPLHRHTRYAEQFYILEGEFTVWAGERKAVLHPGDVFTIPAGTAHAVAVTGAAQAEGWSSPRRAGSPASSWGPEPRTQARGRPPNCPIGRSSTAFAPRLATRSSARPAPCPNWSLVHRGRAPGLADAENSANFGGSGEVLADGAPSMAACRPRLTTVIGE